MRIGFHMLFSGSLKKLKEKVHVSRGNCFQIFARSLRGVDRKGEPAKLQKLNARDLGDFERFLEEKNIFPIVVHAPYSYNLSQEQLDHKQLVIEDLDFAKRIGAPYYVMQPGYFKKLHPFVALENIKTSLSYIMDNTDYEGEILIKNMSGAGTEIASTLEEMNELISFHPKVKGAMDFARAFSAGYSFTTEEDAESFAKEVAEKIGWHKIKLFYINDSERFCGSRKNQFVPLGEGTIGFHGYASLLTKPEIAACPWIVENQPQLSDYDNSIAFLTPFHRKR